MKKTISAVLTLSLAIVASSASPVFAQDADRKVAGGGIAVAGWKGKIDAAAAAKGQSLNDSKFAEAGKDLHLTIGPAAYYWKDANTAKGNYTVSATFKEPKPTGAHPHPYGIFIGGKDLETETPNLVYCMAYSNGTFLVRGFSGGKVVNFAPRAAHAAVAKAAADGSVTQSIAWVVKDGAATCSINGQAVATFDKAALIGEGKLASTDGIYGIRASHNLDVIISGFGKK